jgi:hypothetical protein
LNRESVRRFLAAAEELVRILRAADADPGARPDPLAGTDS